MPAGQPKKFRSARQLIALWSEFTEDIRAEGFITVPTQTNFCRWLRERYKSCDRRTIYNSLNRYFPEIKKEFEQIQSDTIAEGGMLGRYQAAMSIFALKNWCRWSDNPVQVQPDEGRTEELIGGLMDDDLHT